MQTQLFFEHSNLYIQFHLYAFPEDGVDVDLDLDV